MKKRALLYLLFFFYSLLSFGQTDYYIPQASSAPYQTLNQGTKLSPIPGASSTYVLVLPGTWNFFGQQIGDSLIIGDGGFMVTTGPNYSMAFDPFLASMVVGGDPNSGVYYELDTLSPIHSLTIEWREMVLDENPSGDKANFLFRLHKNGVVDFQYGNIVSTGTGSYNSNPGPQVVLALLARDFSAAYEIHYVTGDPSNPTYTNGQGANSFLNDVPDPDTKYSFLPKDLSESELSNVDYVIFPNPVETELRIDGLDHGWVMIIDQTGKLLEEFEYEGDLIEVSHLSTGVYMLKALDEDGKHLFTSSFIKE